MEWAGWLSLIIILCYSSYPGKVKKLERNVKKLERDRKGSEEMSKIISELAGKSCKIKIKDASLLAGSTEVECKVLGADDDWIKFTYTDKKKKSKTKILRIESIDSIDNIGFNA